MSWISLTKRMRFATLTGAVVFTLLQTQLGFGQSAVIYSGNGAQFGGDASNSGVLQGFTDLQNRWNSAGVSTTITNSFSVPADCCIFLATAPTVAFAPGEISALQTFISGGGTFIISHDGDFAPAMNQILSDLGSGMSFGPIQSPAQFTAVVVDDSHPFMAGLSNGDPLHTYSPGQITGGSALVDSPFGTHIVSVESLGAGTIMAVADFDMLNNVVEDYFPNDATRLNNIQFLDNLAASCVIPEPTTAVFACLALLGLCGGRWRRSSC